MFRIERKGPNRLDIALSGKLDAEDMQTALDDLVRQSEGIANGAMLYEIVDFHLPSLGALTVEFSRLPELLKLTRKFERVAVLTDKTWLQKASELEGLLYPGLEIKAFARDQKEIAEAWLAR